MDIESHRMLGIQKVAALIDIDVKTLQGLVDQGRFPQAVNVGLTNQKRLLRWRQPDVLEWLKVGCTSQHVAEAAR